MLSWPPTLLSANLIVCERLLREDTGSMSAIRLVDLCTVSRSATSGAELPIVDLPIYILVTVKFDSSAPPEDHHGHIELTSPLGATGRFATDFKLLKSAATAPIHPGVAYGYSVNMQMTFGIRDPGAYWLDLFIDNMRVAREGFVLTHNSL